LLRVVLSFIDYTDIYETEVSERDHHTEAEVMKKVRVIFSHPHPVAGMCIPAHEFEQKKVSCGYTCSSR